MAKDDQPLIKAALDLNLGPAIPHTMEQWNERWDRLNQGNDSHRKRDCFAMTGQYSVPTALWNEPMHRAELDLGSSGISRAINLHSICDIDLVIGLVLDGDFPISDDATFMYYMLPDVKDTLTANVHIPLIKIEQGDEEPKIPNARFGTMGVMGRLLIRIFFPNMLSERDQSTAKQPNYVGEKYLRPLYDLAVQPATMVTLPEEIRRQWPARYSNEMFRATPHARAAGIGDETGGSQPQKTGREVHGRHFNAWLNEIKRLVDSDEKLDFAQGCFFGVEGKNFKKIAASPHPPPTGRLADVDGNLYDEDNPRTTAVTTVLEGLETSMFRPGEWFLDIATTISGSTNGTQGHSVSLLPRAAVHPEMINLFTKLPIAECTRLVERRNNRYHKDELAQVTAFAGFRVAFADPTPNGVHYFQVYTSDKSVTYHLRGNHKAKHTTAHAVLSDWRSVLTGHCQPLAQVFKDSSSSHSVDVRFESRVGFESYPFVHLAVSRCMLAPLFFHQRNTVWWGFKLRRCWSFTNVLDAMATNVHGRSEFSLDSLPEIGGLLLTTVWQLNALCNRPEEGGNWDEVMHAGSVHAEVDGVTVPVCPLGIYYIHSLRLEPSKLPRMSSLRTITFKKAIYLLSASQEDRTEFAVLRLFRGGIRKRPSAQGAARTLGGGSDDELDSIQPRSSNKQRRVTIRPSQEAEDLFHGKIDNVEYCEPYGSEDEDEELRQGSVPLSQKATNILQCYPIQIFAKVPNRKHYDESWCKLDAADLADIKFNIFADSSKPAALFTSFQDHGRDHDKWQNTVKAHFPTYTEHERLGKIQGLSNLTARNDWHVVLATVPRDSARQMVDSVRRYVNDNWRWLPLYSKGQLWPTGPAIKKAKQVGPEAGGPWIVRNPRLRDD